MRSICEAMGLGEKLGIDLKILKNVMSKSTSACWSLEKNCPVAGVDKDSASSRDYENGFGNALMLKDLELAVENAKEVGWEVNFG